jgi:hypothetical protein
MQELREFNLTRLNLAFEGKKAGALTRMTTVVYRAKVAGGWLVVVAGANGISGVTFYPDPRHEWDGGTVS